ncbi:LysR family transcriptional regulator, partial [Xanthomonas citri pv. citri]
MEIGPLTEPTRRSGAMRFERLDLNLLVALDVLIAERSVSAAAKRLHLSQPAVSGALNRLREFFRDDLLVQVGRQMVLTPKADELADPVRDALLLIRTRITQPAGFDPATAEREFTIVASDYM